MSRLVLLVLFLLLVGGGLYYLSTVPTEQPTSTIEVDVTKSGNAS